MMKPRIETIVPQRMEAVSEGIKNRDFEAFAEITMTDSDDLQAVCRTSDPQIVYATEDSFAIIRLVHAFNKAKGRRVLAYTYDAGANAFLFTLEPNLPEVVAMLLHHFPTPDELCCFNRPELLQAARCPQGAHRVQQQLPDGGRYGVLRLRLLRPRLRPRRSLPVDCRPLPAVAHRQRSRTPPTP